jgi:hypothetical protein
MEERPFEGTESGVSRRSVIKRLGAGTALVWSAPVLQSLATPAHAQVSPGACPDFVCGGPVTQCGGPACGLGPCGCDHDVSGNSVCIDNLSCGEATPCNTNADCPSGWSCVVWCCGQTCAPPCGTCGPGGSEVDTGATGFRL